MCSVLFSNKERQTAFRIQTDKLLEALTRRRSSHGITPVKAAPAPLRCAPAGDTVCRDRNLPALEVLLPRSFGE